jgi:dynein heavy chain
MLRQFCNLYTALVPNDDGGKPLEDADVIESIFIFCLIWSVGGALVKESREKFDTFVKRLSNRSLMASSAGKAQLPSDLIYDAFFDRASLRWIRWADTVRPYVPPVPFEFSKVLVPTVDTTRYTYLLDQVVRVRAPVLFCGESGTAKTITVQNFFHALDLDQYLTLTINFSSRTTSMDVQRVIEANVEKRPGHIFGPPPNKKLLIFIDDINMPQVGFWSSHV